MMCENCRVLTKQLTAEISKIEDLERTLATSQDYMRSQTNRMDQLENALKTWRTKCETLEKSKNEQSISKIDKFIFETKIRQLEGENAELARKLKALDEQKIEKEEHHVTIPINRLLQDSRRPEFFELQTMKLVLEESNPPAEANQLVQSFTDSSKDQKILEKTQKLVDKFHGQYYQYKLALDESIKRLDDYGYGGDENLQPIEIPEFPDPINSQFLSEFETAVKKEAKTKTKQFHVVDDSTCLICRQEMEENEFLGYCDGCFQRYHKECGRVFAQRKLECLAPNCTKKLEGSIFQ